MTTRPPLVLRRTAAAGAIIVLVVAVGAAAVFAWLSWWRPSLHSDEVYGIDVSHHQGRIDWARVAADDIKFAYIKASEGGDFTDSQFALNWQNSERAGVPRGAYHFFTLCRPGEVQARHFLRVAPPDPAALPPALDLEFGGNCARRPSVAVIRQEVRAFLDIVEKAWRRPVLLYVLDSFDRRYRISATFERPLWRRSLSRPADSDWTVWQLHGFARVGGITGRVDLNVAKARELSWRVGAATTESAG